ncbi:FAD-dependent oxidoreductase [Nonlabens ponticola]|uniref:Cyclic nucleotide-binding domain-containing protein n=1 Tax=Nonlabens ponticola TaxID=2496866 RepID=A0A3S9MZ64_9FLAO|nr:cyclic nucleotide-binding domain-containing thioredoxin-disulfide reductase [Nonlabens ponticola]AZQ44470.1 cyclic nucleotide-binding domain-containing protein [Nonlabens ponticola]
MKDPRFPELTARQIKILKEYGEVKSFDKPERIFSLGEQRYKFFVVLDGVVNIEDPTNDNKIIVEHGKNEFTGDAGMLSNRGAQFHAVAQPGTSVLSINPDRIHEIISKHSDISDTLLNAFLQRQETVLNEFTGGLKLIGSGKSNTTYEIRDFLEKNHIWHNFLNVDSSKEAVELLDQFSICPDDLPILINADGKVCAQPNLDELARYTGVLMDFEDRVFDVLVIGAGPSGLAASVYAASEGLSTVTIDSSAPGGQAGKSSKIENYLGFPTGISGSDLANRAYIQAQKFGCNISIPHKAESIEHTGDHFILCASNGKEIKTRALVAATGANYRRLPVDNLEKYEGSGVYYSATGMDASGCENELVGIVGGGNSAGQAAMFLAKFAKHVHVILRGDDLGAKMSDYLVQRIMASERITLHKNTEVTELHGDHSLEKCTLITPGGDEQMEITNLFTFIGAKPCTEWLGDLVVTDPKGFICTGPDIRNTEKSTCSIYKQRDPQSLETSIPGFFAVGDVRNGSVKRVASAVGEGSMVISQVHRFLGELRTNENVDMEVASNS